MWKFPFKYASVSYNRNFNRFWSSSVRHKYFRKFPHYFWNTSVVRCYICCVSNNDLLYFLNTLPGTYKLRKVNLQEEGYNPEKISDLLYVLDTGKKTYVPLTREIYIEILNGRMKFWNTVHLVKNVSLIVRSNFTNKTFLVLFSCWLKYS